jgi:alpha-galactosidase
MNFAGRPRSELRNQIVLNLARDDVKEYIFQSLDKLASENNIKYFKWDMNRPFSEPGWPEAGPANERKLWIAYVRNLYEIIDRLRQNHPKLQYRFLVAMQGALGIGANLNHWSEQDAALGTKMIALYERIRDTVQLGDLFRLLSPMTNDVTANQYVSNDGKQAVLFAFRHSQEFNTPAPAILLHGLDEKAIYRLESVDGKLIDRQGPLSGAYLMHNGVHLNLRGDFDSTAVVFERAP